MPQHKQFYRRERDECRHDKIHTSCSPRYFRKFPHFAFPIYLALLYSAGLDYLLGYGEEMRRITRKFR